ncbi:hypothetical protein LOTGIDRAFT_108573, partial [Lottia gigantea]
FIRKCCHKVYSSYSVVNTARSAIVQTLNNMGNSSFKNQPLVARFMKSLFNKMPTRPRYMFTWDASVLLKLLGSMYPLDKLSQKELTLKTVCLLALSTAHRCPTLSVSV